jgi:putative transposase
LTSPPKTTTGYNWSKVTLHVVPDAVRRGPMKRPKFSEEQIAYALRQVEAGTPPADVCRQLGVGESTFYLWKKKYSHLGVADLSLDKHMLTEALRKQV